MGNSVYLKPTEYMAVRHYAQLKGQRIEDVLAEMVHFYLDTKQIKIKELENDNVRNYKRD